MVRVVQVVSDTNVGGAGRYLLNYLKYYNQEKFEVYVIVPENSKLIELIQVFESVKLIEAPYMADKSYDNRCVTFLTQLFREIKPNILHTHASLSARIAGRKAKVKQIIATRHCIEKPKANLKGVIVSVLNNMLCDTYIAVADAVAENLRECGIKKDKIRTIYNGVEPVRELNLEEINNIKAKLGIKNFEIVFGIFARIEPVKGHRFLLKAAKRVIKEGYRAKILVVGDGSLLPEMKELAKSYGIEGNVIFYGYVKDTTELLNIVDINVISSFSEAMSLAILEAMSLGKPSIATSVGGNVEVVKHNKTGLLVGVADSTSLSESMIRLLEDNKLCVRLSQQAKEEYLKNFTAKNMVTKLELLYTEVLSHDNGR